MSFQVFSVSYYVISRQELDWKPGVLRPEKNTGLLRRS
jgi:hypothetical protein